MCCSLAPPPTAAMAYNPDVWRSDYTRADHRVLVAAGPPGYAGGVPPLLGGSHCTSPPPAGTGWPTPRNAGTHRQTLEWEEPGAEPEAGKTGGVVQLLAT